MIKFNYFHCSFKNILYDIVYLITDFTLKISYLILKYIQSSIHVEALKDLKQSSIWLIKDIKMSSHLLKVPLEIWISEETDMKKLSLWEDQVGKIKTNNNEDKWHKWGIHVTLRESCNLGKTCQGKWTTHNWKLRDSLDLPLLPSRQ